MSLHWWCENCRAFEAVESTGDPEEDYDLGDRDVCIDCGDMSVVIDARAGQAPRPDSEAK